MGRPAAKQGDTIVATDVHLVMVPTPVGTIPMPLPHPFAGTIDGGLSADVRIMGKPAATVNSTATNAPAHLPMPPGTAFQRPPSNRGTIVAGSATVRVNGRPVARTGDAAITCNDPVDAPVGTVVAAGTVFVGA